MLAAVSGTPSGPLALAVRRALWAVGTPVAFVEEQGEKGPQASTVRVLGTHHYVTP